MTAQEREAWTTVCRVYDEFAPRLRQAAALDDDNETAGKVFCEVLERLRMKYDNLDTGGRLIVLALYDILDGVFKDAKKRHENRPGGTEPTNPSTEGKRTA